MNKNVQQGDQRQLLQPQQWAGYESPPQWDESLVLSAPPPYSSSVPSAPPTSLPEYYDQVPGDVQQPLQSVQQPLLPVQPIQPVQTLQQPQPYYPPQYQSLPYQPQQYPPQQHVVSPPAVVVQTTTVNIGGQPAPYMLHGCCGMGNEMSTKVILCVIAVMSLLDFIAVLQFILEGFATEFTPLLFIKIAFALPTAMLFPGSIVALDGIRKGNPWGLSILLNALSFYWWVLLVIAIGTFICIVSLVVTIILIPVAVPLVVLLVFNLILLAIFTEVIKVLTDYRMIMLRRISANRQ